MSGAGGGCCHWPGHEGAGRLHSTTCSPMHSVLVLHSWKYDVVGTFVCMKYLFQVSRHHHTVLILFVRMCIVSYCHHTIKKSGQAKSIPDGPGRAGTVPLLLYKLGLDW